MDKFLETLKGLFGKLPFKNLMEKIPSETRNKIPLLNTLIPLSNYIVSGLILLTFVVIVSGGGSGGSSSGRVVYKDYIGTWGDEYTGGWIISEKEITQIYYGGGTVIHRIDDVIPEINTNVSTRVNFPNGFRFEVTIMEGGTIGFKTSLTIFLHNGKKDITSNDTIIGGIYRKQ